MIETLRKFGFFQYGIIIPGLTLYGKPAPYPVLNERAVRAGAGMTFALGLFSFFQAFYLGNFLFIKILASILFIDFALKVIVGTRFSPISYIADMVVAGQSPEYVGAIQKRFAWSIGLVLSGTMVFALFILNIQGLVNLAICAVCLLFMFMESAFGICVGCKIYALLRQYNVIKKPEHAPVCPGNVCAIE